MSRSPAEVFLGEGIDANDPTDLLGLLGRPISDHAVLLALRERLALIAAHPASESPEADELRLLLHAAAARLLDPALRSQYATGEAGPADSDAAQASVLMTLGMFGGWNRDSLRRLTLIAESQGISRDELVELVRGLGHGGGGAATGRQGGPRSALGPASGPASGPAHGSAPRAAVPLRERQVEVTTMPIPEQMDPAAPVARVVAVFVAVGLALMAGVAVLLVVLVGDGRSKALPSPTAAGPDANPAAASAAANSSSTTPSPTPTVQPTEVFPAPQDTRPAPAVKPAPTRIGDFGDVLHDLASAQAGLEVDPVQAVELFERASLRGAREWPSAEADAQLAALTSQLDFLYRVSNDSELSRRVIAAAAPTLQSPDDLQRLDAPDVAPLVWSAGVLARISRERDLPSPVREQVRRAFAQAFRDGRGPGESSFRSGAVAMALALPKRLTSQAAESDPKAAAAAWEAWLRTVAAIAGDDASMAHQLRLRGLEAILTECPEPNASQVTLDAITQVTTALSWRKDDPSRRALLRWFDSPNVSIADLHALTGVLVTRSSAEGVDYSMALSLASTEAQRAELRARFASVWGLDTEESRAALTERWATQARTLTAAGAPAEAPSDDLAAAVRLARLNEAAARLWRGNVEGVGAALSALEAIKAPVTFGVPTAPGSRPAFVGVDGLTPGSGWAVRYLAAGQHIPQRREILGTITQPPSPFEAEVLVEEACRGAPAQVRADARSVVDRYSTHPAVINALLEFLPSMPATHENADLVRRVSGARVPVPRDPGFKVVCRRALVERLLQALTGAADQGFTDRCAEALGECYAGRGDELTASPAPDTTAPPARVVDAETAAQIERGRLQREAESLVATGREPFTLAALEARRGARTRVAVGRVQAFAAEQVSGAELLAFIVSAEAPGRSDRVNEIVREMTDSRRRASHVFGQLREVELAVSRLWMLRLGVQQQ